MFELATKPRRANLIMAAQQQERAVDAQDDPRMLQNIDLSFLPFAAKTYNISPNIDDYILVVTPICPSDIPNRNGIGFPLSELTTFRPPPVARMAYKAWAGCPVHYEHKNDVHEDAYGIIIDTSLHKINGYGRGALWKVMGVLAIDKKKYPKMAQRILNNEVNTYSMGAYVDTFSCSYCKSPMDEGGWCQHVNPDNDIDWAQHQDYDGSRHLAFRNAHGISPIETSIVESPAWTTALSDHILTR